MAMNFRAFSFATATLAGAAFMALAERPAAAADEIAIGAPLPLTGALSPEGEKLKMGYELWHPKTRANAKPAPTIVPTGYRWLHWFPGGVQPKRLEKFAPASSISGLSV